MLLLTTLAAWRAHPDQDFRSETAAYAPEEDAAALATDHFGDEQVIALVFDHPRLMLPGAVNRETVREIRYGRRNPGGRVTAFEVRPSIAEALDLLPHPEGGWFRETWRTSVPVAAHGGERPTATGIYFLLGPGEESMWHSVRSDEVWLWHRGGPLELVLGGEADTPGERTETVVVGPDVEHGQRPQALVPAGVWQSARPASDREVLVSCVVSPGFDFADFQAAP
ncbi:cupin domain-containing protein [Actinoallomurus rhizosphaericola]|uniref:cupin domain-containing protein n=1 Tax=Actinoallomurus rhizosphaericola TaxID=2952536 RepID=UPI002091D5FC|nr:cupin domain-containing protein [Actinoallomurus rhizosphaericola]MCO5991802.1 cupin domain-containing protein [Actinoallomurus rhizosphaericola]